MQKLSKKFKVDLVYLIGGGFWLMVTQLFTYVGSFILAYVFANYVDPSVYGKYTYVLSLFGLFSLFSLPGIDTAVTQSVAKGYENSYYTGFKTKLRWSVISSVCLILAGGYYVWFGDQPLLSLPLFLGAAILPIMYGSQIFTAFFAGKRLFYEQTKARVTIQLISYVATICVLFVTDKLWVLVLTYLIANAGGNVLFYWLTQRQYQPNRKEDSTSILFGKHLSFLQALNTGTSYVDQLLIFNFLGPVELAVYNFALNPVRQGTAAFQNLGHLLLPKFSEKSMKEIDQRFLSRSFQLLGLGVLMVIGYVAISPWVFSTFFPKYMSSLSYSQLFALTLIFHPVGPYLGSIFRSQKLTRSIYISGASTHIILLGLIILLGYWYGIQGIILARVVSMAYSFVLAIVLWRVEMNAFKK